MLIVGARPNFMKVAPIIRALRQHPATFVLRLVHTGQHYDEAMSEIFFRQLGMPRPDVDLEVGSDSHARQTAAIMTAFEPAVVEWKPDMVLVVGDVNSTIACALVAVKLGIAVTHVEAGLRSFDRQMPEEINRLLTDQISDLLFVSEPSGVENLRREGIPDSRVFLVGNVMIDTLLANREAARALDVPARLGLAANGYGVLTLHRPSNVDSAAGLESIFGGIREVARDVPLVFPVHPRTRRVLGQVPQVTRMVEEGQLRLMEPVGYLEFLGLMSEARVVLTDSGGVQEETTVLGIPCLTLRDSTERPATITDGTNRLVGSDPALLVQAWREMKDAPPAKRVPALWDGGAADRIVAILRDYASGGPA